jgi:hypothetical protein
MTAPIDETSITVARRAIGGFGQDIETRAWVLSIADPEPTPAQIMRYTQQEIAKLNRLPVGWDGGRAVPFHPALANLAVQLVAVLTADRPGLATPQFSPSAEGGVDIIWLVAGNRLTVSLELGEIAIYGTWSGGQDAFPRFEQHWFDLPREQFAGRVGEARNFLGKISTKIQHQLPVL